jgi:predicted chitinase
MDEFLIDALLRKAAFLAQIAHESCELRYMEEMASGEQYEGRKDLGNTRPGDGRRFKGRGPIQLTGRANYARFGDLLGLDLLANPRMAAQPEAGFRIAGLFWKQHNLNELADAGKFDQITRVINGGTNGAADRRAYYERAKRILQPDVPPPMPIHVVVNGKEVTSAQPYLYQDKTLMVALRPMAAAARLRIIDASKGRAIVQDGAKANHRVPMVMRNGTGFVALRDLPGKAGWDGGTWTGSLTTG